MDDQPATSPVSEPPPAARFATIIAALCYSVIERGGNRMPWGELLEPLPQTLRNAMYYRLTQLGRRFAALVARLEAGAAAVLPRKRPSRAGQARTRPVRAPGELVRSYIGEMSPLPRRFGWFVHLTPQGRAYASQMRHLLTQPDMIALVERDPAFQRVLRPLCHMLNIKPARDCKALQPLPPRVRKPRPRKMRPVVTEAERCRAELFSRKTAFGPVRVSRIPRRLRRQLE